MSNKRAISKWIFIETVNVKSYDLRIKKIEMIHLKTRFNVHRQKDANFNKQKNDIGQEMFKFDKYRAHHFKFE
jgi:hypothetical protein